jgi:ribosomal protein L11 methyltransferase
VSWKLIAFAPRPVIEAALVAHEDAFDWDPEIVLSGSEVAEDRPDDWQLEAWLPRKPNRADKAALAALFAGKAPAFAVE